VESGEITLGDRPGPLSTHIVLDPRPTPQCLPAAPPLFGSAAAAAVEAALRLLLAVVLLPGSSLITRRLVVVGVSSLMVSPLALAAFVKVLPAMACLCVRVVGARVSREIGSRVSKEASKARKKTRRGV